MPGFEDESITSTIPAPPEIEAPSPPRVLSPLLCSPPPPPLFCTAIPLLVDLLDSTRSPGKGAAANLIPLASQILLLLPLVVFLWFTIFTLCDWFDHFNVPLIRLFVFLLQECMFLYKCFVHVKCLQEGRPTGSQTKFREIASSVNWKPAKEITKQCYDRLCMPKTRLKI